MEGPLHKYCRYCIHCIAQDEKEGVCEEKNIMVKKTAVRDACGLFEFCEIDAFYCDRGTGNPEQAVYKPREKKEKQCRGQMTLENLEIQITDQEREV